MCSAAPLGDEPDLVALARQHQRQHVHDDRAAGDDVDEAEVVAEARAAPARIPTARDCGGRSCSRSASLTPTSTPHDVQSTEPSVLRLNTDSILVEA